MASFNKRINRVLSCIQQGANDEARAHLEKLDNFCDHKDDSGLTLLHRSVTHGNVDMVNHLIQVGCNVNVRDNYGNTPLMLATKKSDMTIVQLLLKRNADIYLNNNGKSSFHLAAQHRLLDSSFILLHHNMHHIFDMFVEKAYENFRTSQPGTTSSLLRSSDLVKLGLVVFGNVELAKFLLDNGYATDFCKTKRGFTALHWAVCMAKRETAKMLIRYGANVNFLDANKQSPLYYYIEKLEAVDEQSEVLIALVTAKLATVHQHELANLQHEIEHLLKEGNKETVRTILKSGIEINSINFSDGQSLLHVLIENWNGNVIDLFAELNILFDVNARTESKITALMIAARYGFLRKVKFLLKRGAEVNLISNIGESALFYACQYYAYAPRDNKKLVAIIELLLQHGVNAQMLVYGKTILDRLQFSEQKDSLGKVIMAHLVLQKEISHSPLSTSIRENIRMERILKAQHDLCVKQIEQMKNIEVHKKVSLFELLAEKGEKKMLLYARDETFASAFYSAIKMIPSDSYYFKILKKGIKKVIDKIELHKETAAVLDALTGLCCDVYHHIIYQIISYLDDHDLHNLCQAANFPL